LKINDLELYLAEAVRFELTNPCGLPVFKTGAIDHSAKLPEHERCSKSPRRYLRLWPASDKPTILTVSIGGLDACFLFDNGLTVTARGL
jgi:hypothetical protein